MTRGCLTKKERVRRAMHLLGPNARLSEVAYLANMSPTSAVRLLKQLRAKETVPLSGRWKDYPIRGSSRWTLPEAKVNA